MSALHFAVRPVHSCSEDLVSAHSSEMCIVQHSGGLPFPSVSASGAKPTLVHRAAKVWKELEAAGLKSQPSLTQQTERLGYALHRSLESGHSLWLQRNLEGLRPSCGQSCHRAQVSLAPHSSRRPDLVYGCLWVDPKADSSISDLPDTSVWLAAVDTDIQLL